MSSPHPLPLLPQEKGTQAWMGSPSPAGEGFRVRAKSLNRDLLKFPHLPIARAASVLI